MDRKWWTLGAVCVGIFMLLLDVTIVNVALPSIEHATHASLSDLQWVLDAYALTLASLLLTSGSLADLLGRRVVFSVGIVAFTAGSLLCGVATGPLFLILARAFQGVGGAIMFATSLALLANAFRGRDRGTAFGIYGAVSGVAVAIGPVLGGLITSGIGWRWIFFVNVPIGLLALVVTLLRVEESRNPAAPPPDWVGFVTFSAGLGALVFALIRSTADGWSSGVVVWSLVASAILLATFVFAELRRRAPMLDLALLRKPTFTGGLLAGFALSASLFAVLTYLVLYLQNVLRLSAVATGLRFLVLSGALFLTAGVAGRLTNTVPVKWMMAPGFALVGVGLFLMHGITPSDSWTHLVPGLAIAGLGAGFVNVPLVSTAVGVVEPERAGMASGINSTFRQVGIATGIAALGSIFAAQIRSRIANQLASTPFKAMSSSIADAALNGRTTVGSLAGQRSGPPAHLVRSVAAQALIHGLNEILVIGAAIAFAGALATALLVRQKDFTASAAPGTSHTRNEPTPSPAGATIG